MYMKLEGLDLGMARSAEVQRLGERKKPFDKLLLDSVDDALSSLGESARQSIYFHLEDKFKITRKDIPRCLTDFTNGLERIFGAGARFIEILIMKNLYQKIDQPLKWKENKELVFVDYVSAARRSFSERSKG